MNIAWAVVKIRPQKKFRPARDLNEELSCLPKQIELFNVFVNSSLPWFRIGYLQAEN